MAPIPQNNSQTTAQRSIGSGGHGDSEWNFCDWEAYAGETRKATQAFLRRQVSFADCIAALDAALARFIPTVTDGELPRLRAMMFANNQIVMEEVDRRESLSNSTLPNPEMSISSPYRKLFM
jgi:hypothetical protein